MKEMVNGFTVEDMAVQSASKSCGCNSCGMQPTGPQKSMMKQNGIQQDVQSSVMQQPMMQQNGMNQTMTQQGMYEGMIDCNTCVQESVGLAQAYVPFQTQLDLKDGQTALACGTVFAQLVQPYVKNSRM